MPFQLDIFYNISPGLFFWALKGLIGPNTIPQAQFRRDYTNPTEPLAQ